MAIQGIWGEQHLQKDNNAVGHSIADCAAQDLQWELLRNDILCLTSVESNGGWHDPARTSKAERQVQAALYADQAGNVEFCAAETLSSQYLSACLASLADFPAMTNLRLTGHLTEQSVPSLCRLLENSKSLRSLECGYQTLPISLLETVAKNLHGQESALTHLRVYSSALTTRHHLFALDSILKSLPRLVELNVVCNNDLNYDSSGIWDLIGFNFCGRRTFELQYEDWALDEIRAVLRMAAQTKSHLDELRISKKVSLFEGTSPVEILENIQLVMPRESRLVSVDLFASADGSNEEWRVEWRLGNSFRVYLNFFVYP